MPVRPQEEDRTAIAFEQHHRVIDQSGQDAVQVEPAGNIRQLVSNRIEAGLASGHQRDEIRLGDSRQCERMLPAKMSQPDNTDSDRLDSGIAHSVISILRIRVDVAGSWNSR